MPASLLPFVPLTGDPLPAPRTAFDQALRALLDDLFAALPTWATQMGFHGYDDRWPDVSEAGRRARLDLYARHRAALEGLDAAALTPDERIDRGIVVEALEGFTFDDGILREGAWDALGYVALLGNGLHELLARDYAPWRHRGSAFLARVQRLADVLEAARANLVGLPGRPVSLLHVETAIAQLPGIAELIDEGIAEGSRHEGDPESAIAAALRGSAAGAREALAAFGRFLEEDVRPRAEGEGRLGTELFAAKLRHTLSSDQPHERLRERARRDYTAVRGELVRLARGLWPTARPGEPLPGADDAVVDGVWDAIARDHPRSEDLLDLCRTETTAIEGFVRQRGIITLPEDPLRIAWTPLFLRPYGGAFLSPPGPLDQGQLSEFWVTPPDPEWSAERLESYLREENDRMLRILCIHEAIPGHYLQLAASNRSSSLARSVFQSGTFAEGWAVYVTQVMMDEGYGADDPALLFCHWKYYLRAIVNTLLDIGVHVEGMGEDEAMRLMIGGAFQEEQEARAKYLRARLSSTQLSTYYVGSLEMWDLETAARRRAAVAAGAGAGSVPEPRLVGGFGETPGFDRRTHLEAVISHGTPPIRWVRRILFDTASAP
ncbi:MAG: hypothetical protein XU10_C0028G0015 [Chloroflexi bacterium CSP1-4]|nr:MAG: hypothetical protein XU10_C0028G0015 [Chloroflexi bacterium CSP1-4]